MSPKQVKANSGPHHSHHAIPNQARSHNQAPALRGLYLRSIFNEPISHVLILLVRCTNV